MRKSPRVSKFPGATHGDHRGSATRWQCASDSSQGSCSPAWTRFITRTHSGCFNVSVTNDLAPLDGFALDQPAKVGARSSHRGAAKTCKVGHEVIICEHCIDFAVQYGNDVRRRGSWRSDAVPRVRLVIRND